MSVPIRTPFIGSKGVEAQTIKLFKVCRMRNIPIFTFVNKMDRAVEPMEDVAEDELVILRIETDDEGNDVYATVEDDAELDAVFEKYLEIAEADEEEE